MTWKERLKAWAKAGLLKLLEKLLGKKVQQMRALTESIRAQRDSLGESVYDFYRCQACHTLITRVEEMDFFDSTSSRYSKVCVSCGYRRYHPTNPVWWEFLLPRVMKFAVYRIAGIA